MSRSFLNLLLYFVCQALAASSTSVLVAESALVGAMLTHDPRLATLPVALQQLATLLTTYPASHLMARVGRRAGFSLGALFGLLGGAVTTLAILRGSFALFCGGSFLVGGYSGFATFYRFAAAESAEPEKREHALGWVMSAGVLAAVLGPWLARRTKEAWSTPFAASYALLFGMALLALLCLQLLRVPAPQAASTRGGASVREIARRPSFLIAAAAAMVAGAGMNFVMTATPLAMAKGHHSFDHTAFVIQWHVLAMFAPSFVTGRLISRFGAPQMVLAGLLVSTLCVVVNVSGTSVAHFWTGQFLLGLGWNFAFLGATALLARAHAPQERATAQGLNDCLVFSSIAISSLLAGVVEHAVGWRAVNLAILLPVGAVALAIAAHLRAERASQRPAV
ncbi:MFS transporter [Archangium sp.]|uniref:MFS transporter n=1 Tax=Archangium sp. TaxID=1872627 RepID=UPI002D4CF16B|nr:MFS transporter [Archangium sp.]HYO55261.1 MFS transporter [Archangium sp.]